MPAQNMAPDRAAYNVLFAALGKEGLVAEALACFERMQAEQGLYATPYDYGTLIAACGQAVERLPDLDKTEMKMVEVEAEKERLVGLARRLLGLAAEGAAKRARAGIDGGMSNCFMQVLKVLGKAGRADEARALLGACCVRACELGGWGLTKRDCSPHAVGVVCVSACLLLTSSPLHVSVLLSH